MLTRMGGNRRWIRLASMSVPPVVALPRRISPKPMPQNNPPYTVASHMSCTGKCRDAPSSSREKAMVAISERMPKRSPRDFMDTRNSGTFSAREIAPMGRPVP